MTRAPCIGAGGPGVAAGERDLETGCDFLRGGARPPVAKIEEFIDANRDDVVEGVRLGVKPVVTVLRDAGVAVAPSSYYAHKTRPPSKRAVRDAELVVELARIWEANYRVSGVRKVYMAALRAGAGDRLGPVPPADASGRSGGVTRAKTVKTTRPDPAAGRHPDLVKRDFTASGPNQLWVTDLTYVPTWAGVGYVCFITDVYSRMIVGWRVASHMRTGMVLDAIEMARWNRGPRQRGRGSHRGRPTPKVSGCTSGDRRPFQRWEVRPRSWSNQHRPRDRGSA